MGFAVWYEPLLGSKLCQSDVTYRDANNEQVHVWATSWGVSPV